MKKLKIILILTILISAGLINSLYCQENQASALTLNEAVQKALAQNLDLKQYANQVQSSAINFSQNINNLLPDLSASASASQRYSKATSSETQSVSTGLQSSVNVFNGFADVAAIRQAKFELKTDELTLERKKEEIIYQTIQLFIQAIMDQELIRIEEENMATQTEQLKRIKEFYENGNRSLADLLQQRSDIAQAELQLINARNSFQLSRLNFLAILGETPETEYTLIAPPDKLFEQDKETPAFEQTLILEKRFDWRAQQQSLLAADQQIQISKSSYWPSMGLNLSAGTSYSSENSALTFFNQMDETNPNISAGLSFSLPLFNRFQTKNNVQLAKIKKQNEQLVQDKLNVSIQLSVRQAWLEYVTALKQWEVGLAKLDYAQQAYDVTGARYNVGSATYVELSQSRTSLYSASNDALQAGYDVVLKRIAFHYQQGNLDTLLKELDLTENQI